MIRKQIKLKATGEVTRLIDPPKGEHPASYWIRSQGIEVRLLFNDFEYLE